MALMRTIFSGELPPVSAGTGLTEALREQYGGDLSFPSGGERPYVFANFVTTLDGVASFNIPGQSGGAEISGRDAGDRFIMGLLRASADAILVGAGTLAAVGKRGLWTPEFINPPATKLYQQYRLERLAKSENPLVVVVSGSGEIELERDLFKTRRTRVLIVTTKKGGERLAQRGVEKYASTQFRILPGAGEAIAPAAILDLLKNEFGARRVLHEGGPTFFSSFLRDSLIDELFLTLAPQIAGNTPQHSRPGLVSHLEFTPANASWLTLLSVKQAGSFLYLRHRRSGA